MFFFNRQLTEAPLRQPQWQPRKEVSKWEGTGTWITGRILLAITVPSGGGALQTRSSPGVTYKIGSDGRLWLSYQKLLNLPLSLPNYLPMTSSCCYFYRNIIVALVVVVKSTTTHSLRLEAQAAITFRTKWCSAAVAMTLEPSTFYTWIIISRPVERAFRKLANPLTWRLIYYGISYPHISRHLCTYGCGVWLYVAFLSPALAGCPHMRDSFSSTLAAALARLRSRPGPVPVSPCPNAFLWSMSQATWPQLWAWLTIEGTSHESWVTATLWNKVYQYCWMTLYFKNKIFKTLNSSN